MADKSESVVDETPEVVDVEITEDMEEELNSMGKGEE